MNNNTDKNEVYLLPGEFHFGDRNSRITTLLGSCIAITLWHPQKLIGGMCHFMLPSPQFRTNPQQLDGKYAEDAIKLFMQEIKSAGTIPQDYQVKIFGGGAMFATETVTTANCTPNYHGCIRSNACKQISCKNRLIAPFLLQQHGFNITNHDLGGTKHRKVIFELWSGDVWQRKGS